MTHQQLMTHQQETPPENHRNHTLNRRSFMQLSAASAVGCCVMTEPLLARAREPKVLHKDAIMIDANENPLGLSEGARQAIMDVLSDGGRYCTWLTDALTKEFASQQGLKPDYVAAYPGSSEPLHHAVITFTSTDRSYVTADPGYEAGAFAAEFSHAPIVKVPLTASYAHDVRAMLAASSASAPSSKAGLFYICSPNNPTGTLTSHSDIEYLVANKPKNSVVLVDEAYIHFSDGVTAIDLVKEDKDVIVLRTCSKLYGMAGLRCGFAVARPDLLAKISAYAGWNAMPITAVSAALASLKDTQLVAERKRSNLRTRESVFEWLKSNRYSYVPSQSNCFMLDTKRDGKEVIDAMRKQNVFIGRIWPVWPTHVRVTVGTGPEMEVFQRAFQSVMTNKASARPFREPAQTVASLDGLRLLARQSTLDDGGVPLSASTLG